MGLKDVMIGDWVRIKDNVEPGAYFMHDDMHPGQYVEIEEILSYGINPDWCCGEINSYLPEDAIEPIPLTVEILEKNGFIKDTDKDDRSTDVYHLLVPTGFERKSFTIQVSLYREPICGVSTLVKCWGWLPPYNAGMNDIHLCSANYVHQLQHALRLCGIEKEIEL